MSDKKRLGNIIGATMATIFVLALFLIFGPGPGPATAGTNDPNPVVITTDGDNQLATENDQLRQAVQTMQEREAAYQAEIQKANDLLTANQGYGQGEYEEEEEYEEDEDEEYDDD
ncbi:MAG TPA: hypothetical protein VLL52_00870 [Anaerolineae bacterium]|nr:hypothetical protein [Anaerolineae bacterium]